jgi:hypothetical protein
VDDLAGLAGPPVHLLPLGFLWLSPVQPGAQHRAADHQGKDDGGAD